MAPRHCPAYKTWTAVTGGVGWDQMFAGGNHLIGVCLQSCIPSKLLSPTSLSAKRSSTSASGPKWSVAMAEHSATWEVDCSALPGDERFTPPSSYPQGESKHPPSQLPGCDRPLQLPLWGHGCCGKLTFQKQPPQLEMSLSSLNKSQLMQRKIPDFQLYMEKKPCDSHSSRAYRQGPKPQKNLFPPTEHYPWLKKKKNECPELLTLKCYFDQGPPPPLPIPSGNS